MSWTVNVGVYFDENPKVIKAGAGGADLLLWLLRLAGRQGFGTTIPPDFADLDYIAGQRRQEASQVKDAVDRCVRARILSRLEDGALEILPDPDWTQAQSDAARAKTYRERKKLAIATVTDRHDASRYVTTHHEPSRPSRTEADAETPRHDRHAPDHSGSDPFRSDPDPPQTPPSENGGQELEDDEPTPEDFVNLAGRMASESVDLEHVDDVAARVAALLVDKLNRSSGSSFEPSDAGFVRRVAEHLADGRTELELRLVVWHECRRLQGNTAHRHLLKPNRIFGEGFAQTLAQAREAWAALGGEEIPVGKKRARAGPTRAREVRRHG